MRRAVPRVWNGAESSILPSLLVTAICFFIGGLAGCLLAGCAEGSGIESLTAYLEDFLYSAEAGKLAVPSIAAQVWDLIRWPLFAILLGYTALGLFGLPFLFITRGFLLGLSIASFVRLFGSPGCLAAFVLFGISGMLSVPVLFVLGVQSLISARHLAGYTARDTKTRFPYRKGYVIRCGVCGAALCVCVLLERFAVPILLSGLAGAFLTG